MRLVATNVQPTSDVRARAGKLGIPLVGESPTFLRLLQVVDRVARHGNGTVLIRGETGTGKELLARATHYLGPRSNFPFVPVNCGALPESLAENELFGHRSGAFTSAGHDSLGLVRLAHRGTLFLDEVDCLPLKAQIGLLRFLQDGRFRPLGGSREESADVRVIAACNGNLEDGVVAGRFRQDLYYRLNLLTLDVPPLRLRTGDASLLARYFLDESARRCGLSPRSLSESTARWFDQYCWPGNVRELENLLYRECLLSDESELRIVAPDRSLRQQAPQPDAPTADSGQIQYKLARSRALEEFDRAYLVRLLDQAQGNVTRAAALAGKERRALGKLLKRYRITPRGAHR
jgi:two-component system response regulator GlrR